MLMEFLLSRIAKKKGYTIGKLYVVKKGRNRYQWICDTLEPQWRDYKHGGRKIDGKSAIPEGRYPLVVIKSPRFDMWVPKLLMVPMFKGVEIHAGNTAKDTEGCILPGINLKKGMVFESRKNLAKIMDILKERKVGEPAFINIR